MRDQLIEILEGAGKMILFPGSLANILIENGVTIKKWIPVTERLPEQDGEYLVCRDIWCGQWIYTLRFAKDGEKVCAYDLKRKKNVWYDYDSEWGYSPIYHVTHWMPLPEPPK